MFDGLTLTNGGSETEQREIKKLGEMFKGNLMRVIMLYVNISSYKWQFKN